MAGEGLFSSIFKNPLGERKRKREDEGGVGKNRNISHVTSVEFFLGDFEREQVVAGIWR